MGDGAGTWLRREVIAAEGQSEGRKMLLHELAQREICGYAECPSRVRAREHAAAAQAAGVGR